MFTVQKKLNYIYICLVLSTDSPLSNKDVGVKALVFKFSGKKNTTIMFYNIHCYNSSLR